MHEAPDVTLYNSDYAKAQSRQIPKKYLTLINEWLIPSYEDKILELGSGGGDLLRFIRSLSPFTIGLDISHSALSESGCDNCVTGRAQALPFPDESFDKIVSLHTLEHIEDTERVLQELDRVTKPGGLSLHVFPSPFIDKREGAIGDVLRTILARENASVTPHGLLDALTKSLEIADRIHPHALTPEILQDKFVGTHWKIVKAKKMFIPTERGFAWIVLLKKEEELVAEHIATQPQIAAASVASYLEFLNILDSGAEYYLTKLRLDPQYNDPSLGKKDVKLILEDLYFAPKGVDGLDRFKRDWGDDYYLFENALSSVRPMIQKTEETIFNSAYKLTPLDRLKITIQAALSMTKDLSAEQKARVLSPLGYSYEEITDITKKMAESAGFTVGSGIAAGALVSAAAFYGASHPFVEQNTQKDLVVFSTIIAHYLSAILRSTQNVRMLKDPEIGTSTNLLSTCVYLLANKLLPDKAQLQKWSTFIVGMLPALQSEFYLLPPGLTNPEFILSAITAKNISGTIFNAAIYTAVEWWMRNKTKNK